MRQLILACVLLGCEDTLPLGATMIQEEPQERPKVVGTLAVEPSFNVGLADGPEEFLFSQIAGAVRLRDGGVMVAVQGYHQIRRFGPDGGHLWTAGRQGQGPGEFMWAELLPACATESSIVVYDSQNTSITKFDGEGNLVASDLFAQSPYGFGLQCAPGGRLVFSDFGDMYSDEPTFRWSNTLAYADEADSDIVVLVRHTTDDHSVVGLVSALAVIVASGCEWTSAPAVSRVTALRLVHIRITQQST